VHRMAGLVREREDVVQHGRLVVHQNVRVAVVAAGAERAALLAGVGIAVAPPAGKSLFQHAGVLLA